MSASRLAVGVLAAAALVAHVVGASRPESRGGGRTPGTSLNDQGPQGLTIFATLLDESGRDVRRLSEPPATASLESDETAVLLDAGGLADEDRQALAEFVEGGGRLIIGGSISPAAIEAVSGISVQEGSGSGESAASPLVPIPETSGVTAIEASGDRFSDVGEALPIAGDPGGDLAAIATPGEGAVVLLADSSPLQNGTIADADNATFAVDLAGEPDRPVAFIESLAGGGEEATGLAALPTRWAYAALLLMLAALAFLWARFRRLGEPDRAGRELQPPRSRYVDGLADALARTNSAAIAGEPVRIEARRRLLAGGGLADDADPEMHAGLAARQGLDPEQAAALAHPLEDEQGAIRAGSALAKLWR